eukprot:8505914-Pyramimonas_sp.AAC.1
MLVGHRQLPHSSLRVRKAQERGLRKLALLDVTTDLVHLDRGQRFVYLAQRPLQGSGLQRVG